MKLHIPRDVFDNPTPPRLILCQTNREKIGELPAYDIQLNAKWNSYSELSFTINRMYNDALTGETKVHPLFDLAEGLRKVYVEGFGYFVIQDPDTEYSDNETKKLSCFSIEYETGQKYLENFFVNTGEDESVEVTYWANKFGNDYFNKDKMYKKVPSNAKYNKFIKYYTKSYGSETNGYMYKLTEVKDSGEFDELKNNLYIEAWPNVQFYNETNKQLSLLHLIFKKIPEWNIGQVDSSLWKQERKFEEDRVPIYDFLMNDICDKFKCVIEWDTVNMTVNFYEEQEDDIADDSKIQTRFNTNVFISRDNLANSINIKYSTDDIKTKLKVVGENDLDIREVNLGQNYIMNLDYYHTPEWMGQELCDKYTAYKKLLVKNEPKYEKLMEKWVQVYNIWDELNNQVPENNSVISVGDTFKKLYCTYTKVNVLRDKLVLLGVKEDTKGISSDNVLLSLKNDNSSVVIRVYYDASSEFKDFKVKRILSRQDTEDETSIDITEIYSLSQWVNGELTDTKMGLVGFSVNYIGTLGAYLCLTRDESKEENLEDYGIRLLKEKQEIYTTIFSTQTENLLSQIPKEDSDIECIVCSGEPEGDFENGTRRLDISTYPLELYEYRNGAWVLISFHEGIPKVAMYKLYKENLSKLKAVQLVLKRKERRAKHRSYGQAITNKRIKNSYIAKIQDAKAQNDEATIEKCIKKVFKPMIDEYIYSVYDINTTKLDEPELDVNSFVCSFGIHFYNLQDKFESDKIYYIKKNGTFVKPKTQPTASNFTKNTYYLAVDTVFAAYVKNETPYIGYYNSLGVLKSQMNYVKSVVDMEKYFSEEDWLRLSPFIKEDEFNDSSFALTGYESEENRLSICRDLKSAAEKELQTLSRPSLEFSMDMANILAIPEFDPIRDNFALGNFITVGIRDDYIKKARILEVTLDFDDISNLKATFGNLVTTKSEIDKHADLLKQAVNAGKSVAANANSWQKAVDKSNSIDKAIREGLRDAALEVGAAHGQNITWDQYGIWGRKLIDGTTDTYEDEQFKLINNKLVFTDDNWVTSKSVFGKFKYKNQLRWGLLADCVIGGYIEGSEIYGGTIDIGNGAFMVDELGAVTMGGDSKVGNMTVQDVQDYMSRENNVVYASCPIHGKYLANELWIVGANDYIQTDKEGNIIDSDGNVIEPTSMGTVNVEDMTISDNDNIIGRIIDNVVVDINDEYNIIGIYDDGRKTASRIVGYVRDGEAFDQPTEGTEIGIINKNVVKDNDGTLIGLINGDYIISANILRTGESVDIQPEGVVLRTVNDGDGVYKSTDWVSALTKYDDQHNTLSGEIDGIQKNLDQHFKFDSDGLIIKDSVSNIYTQFRNDRWAFMQKASQEGTNEDIEVAYVSNKKLYISSAEIGINEDNEDNRKLDVHGSATVEELSVNSNYANRSLTIRAETNGSFSILIETT